MVIHCESRKHYTFFKFSSVQNAQAADDNLSWLSRLASVLPATEPGDAQLAGTALPAAASPPTEFRRKVSQQSVAVTRGDADHHRSPLHHLPQRRHLRRRRTRVGHEIWRGILVIIGRE